MRFIGIPPIQGSSHMVSPMELLPTGIPPNRDSSRNWIPPETGFLLKRDSSQNGIPPKTGFLPKRDSSQMGFLLKLDSSQEEIPPKTGFLPKTFPTKQDYTQNKMTPRSPPYITLRTSFYK